MAATHRVGVGTFRVAALAGFRAAALVPSLVREDSQAAKVSQDAGAFRPETEDSPADSILRVAHAALVKAAGEAIIAVVDFTAAVTTAATILDTATDSATMAARTAIPMAIMTSGVTGFPAAGSLPTTAVATTAAIKIAA